MQENWKKWEPIKDSSNKYIINSIKFNSEAELQIALSEFEGKEKKTIFITFTGINNYRMVNEKIKNYVLAALASSTGSYIYMNWTFFKVGNSSYLKWLLDESDTLSEIFYGIKDHYVIASKNILLEVASNSEPVIEIID